MNTPHLSGFLVAGSKSDSNFLWRPFVIDLDLPDYEFSAKGGAEATYKLFRTLRTPDRNPLDPGFRKSWVFIEIAVEIIDQVLQKHFGFLDRKWVSSGNKGVHCWVLDERACAMRGAQRRAILNYITTDEGFFKASYGPCKTLDDVRNIKASILQKSLYLQRCYSVIRSKMTVLLEDQNLWDDATMQVCCAQPGSEAAASKLKKSVGVHWYDYERVDRLRAVEFALKVALPRLDMHAANHGQMTKIPFSIHDKTGLLAVPFDPAKVDVFDPALAPTVQDAIDYHDIVSKGGAPIPGKNIGAYAKWFAKRPIVRQFIKEEPNTFPVALGVSVSYVPPKESVESEQGPVKRPIPEGLKGLFKSASGKRSASAEGVFERVVKSKTDAH